MLQRSARPGRKFNVASPSSKVQFIRGEMPAPQLFFIAIAAAAAATAAAAPPTLYGHAFNAPLDFSDAEYAHIAATFPVFTVEKRHAFGVYGNASLPAPFAYNSIAASIGTARKIKALNASVKVLMYWNSALNWNMYECEADVQPSWLLPPRAPLTNVSRYNLASPQFRAWWTACAVDALRRSEGALDGLFLDALPKLTWPGNPPDAFALWGGMVDAIKAAVPGAWLIYNGFYDAGGGGVVANASLLAHTSALYVECLSTLGSGAPVSLADATPFLRSVAAMARAADRADKAYVGHGFGPVADPGDARFLFGYAVFLLTATGGAREMFLANDGYEIDQGLMKTHAEYALELGAPTGAFVVVNSTALRRDFARATVVVDMARQRAEIALTAAPAQGAAPPRVALPTPDDVATDISRVTATFRSHTTPGDCHWEQATYFFGHTGAMLLTSNASADVAFARAWAAGNAYACGGALDPNDFGSGWGYSALDALAPGAPDALALGATMAAVLAGHKLPPYSWWWVDTLAMNVPQWLYYGHALERPDFSAFAYQQYNDTKFGTGAPGKPALFDPTHSLWYRDATFVGTSPPVFWARGQAWAAVTIVKALSLGVLPAWHPWAQDLEATLAAMAAAVVPLQGADGFWRSNLLDAAAFPQPETTGTAGLLALLAFGVRTGRLPAPEYLPAVAAAWGALSSVALRADGTVGNCQPEGKEPGPSSPANSSAFCTGLFLLAAAEVHALVAGPPLPPHDLRAFEGELLPRWLAQFALAAPTGGFAFSAGEKIPHAYGSAGVVHALSVVGQLDSLFNASARAAMGAVANSFENATTGFYELSGHEESTGYQPWHSGGWVLSALRLLGVAAAAPPATAVAFAAAGADVWEPTMMRLLNGSESRLDVWAASHRIASLPAQLIMSDASWARSYAPFFDWLWPFLNATSSATWGYWCLNPAVNPPPPSNVCLGGAFHIAFVLACGGQPLPHAAEMLNSTLALQNASTGLWSSGAAALPSYMDQDGVYVALKASRQLGRARWPEVRKMCAAFVRAAAAVLTSDADMLGPASPFGGITHNLAGLVTPVALCAEQFPDLVVTSRPWVSTVDVGCFG